MLCVYCGLFTFCKQTEPHTMQSLGSEIDDEIDAGLQCGSSTSKFEYGFPDTVCVFFMLFSCSLAPHLKVWFALLPCGGWFFTITKNQDWSCTPAIQANTNIKHAHIHQGLPHCDTNLQYKPYTHTHTQKQRQSLKDTV